jgi:hypothetical protein
LLASGTGKPNALNVDEENTMKNQKLNLTLAGPLNWWLAVVMSSMLVLLPVNGGALAQSGGTIDTGVAIPVRTSEPIDVDHADGRIFSGAVDEDVRDTRGNVAVPRGTNVELIVRSISDKEYALDLESITIDGRRMAVEAENSAVSAQKEGIGANSRTGKYVGGGAAIGAIIGAIAGGGKGAAIGAGVGAAGGAGTQVLTRGKNVDVPAEALVTFRLEQPLRTGVPDRGFSRNGNHYHSGYGTTQGNSRAYEEGLKAGRSDRERNRTFSAEETRWTGADRRDYADGYERGYDESARHSDHRRSDADIRIGADHVIAWHAPSAAQVFVQVDDEQRRLFGAGASGNQPAPWIQSGHRYTFILVDSSGRELARDENDLRERRAR